MEDTYMKKEIIDKIIADKGFLEKIINSDSVEKVKEAFKEKGIDLTVEDIKIIAETVQDQIENNQNTLDAILEKTSGGVSFDHKKFKNISMGLAAIAVAISAVYAASRVESIGQNVDETVEEAKKSWFWSWFGSGSGNKNEK